MNLTISKKDFLRALARMQGVAERKSTMPVLANVLLEARADGTLRIAATDLFLSLTTSIPADVTKPGSVAVSAKDLFERVKNMPDGPLSVASQENATTTLKASGTARRYTLRGMPGGDFPPLPRPADDAATLALEVVVLSDLIVSTHFAISTDETRSHLNSALFEWEGETVRMVATDGHRLAKRDIVVAGRQASTTLLIPLKAINELRRFCEEVQAGGATEIQITPSGSSAFFQTGGTTFSVKLVDAQFPPYAQVIPKDCPRTLRVPRAALTDAVKAVSVAADKDKGGVRMALSKGAMQLKSESPDSGDGVDELPCDYDGPNMSIGFNAKYLLDVLGALSIDEIAIGLNGELDPLVVRPGDETGAMFDGVIMPMRL